MEAYIEICISSFIKVKEGQFYTDSRDDTIDAVFAGLYLVLILSLPIWHIAFFTYNHEKLKSDEGFYDKYETLFEGISLKSFMTFNFSAWLMIRRLFFVLVIMFVPAKSITLQIFVSVFGASCILIILIVNKPYLNSSNAKI
jgi:hypothetical protein